MIFFLLALFAASFLITLTAVPLVRRWAVRVDFVDFPGGRKGHREPTPLGGGLALALGLTIPILLSAAAAGFHHEYKIFDFLPHAVTIHAAGVVTKLPSLALLLAGGLVILALGAVDDRRGLSPGFKLLVQVIVGTGLVIGGERLSLFSEDDGLGRIVAGVVTVLWVVGITNAFNLLDHMDGLSTGIALIVSAAFLAVALQTGQWFIACLLVPLMGACCGFLKYNFPPARIFLGDAGSTLLGFFLGALTIPFTFYARPYPLYSYFVPLAILSVPLFDTAVVVFLRWKERRPIFQGDMNHFAHRLIRIGLTPRAAVLVIYLLTLCSGLGAVLLYQVDLWGAVLIMGQLLLFFGIMLLLETGVSRDF